MLKLVMVVQVLQLEELDQAPKVEQVINGQLMQNKVKTQRLKLLTEHLLQSVVVTVELDHGTTLYKVKQVLEDLVVELQVIMLEQVAEMVQEQLVKVMLVQVVIIIMLEAVAVEQVVLVQLVEVIMHPKVEMELRIVF